MYAIRSYYDTVSVGSGANTFISKDKVIRLVKKLTDEQKYENLKLVCPADDFEAQMKLGLWARLHNLPEQAKEHFENAVKLKPDDPKARRAAGYIFKNQQCRITSYNVCYTKLLRDSSCIHQVCTTAGS